MEKSPSPTPPPNDVPPPSTLPPPESPSSYSPCLIPTIPPPPPPLPPPKIHIPQPRIPRGVRVSSHSSSPQKAPHTPLSTSHWPNSPSKVASPPPPPSPSARLRCSLTSTADLPYGRGGKPGKCNPPIAKPSPLLPFEIIRPQAALSHDDDQDSTYKLVISASQPAPNPFPPPLMTSKKQLTRRRPWTLDHENTSMHSAVLRSSQIPPPPPLSDIVVGSHNIPLDDQFL